MAGYHPFLFTLLALLAITEVGFTAYFVNRFEDNNAWPTDKFRSLTILLLCKSCLQSRLVFLLNNVADSHCFVDCALLAGIHLVDREWRRALSGEHRKLVALAYRDRHPLGRRRRTLPRRDQELGLRRSSYSINVRSFHCSSMT